MKKFIDFFRRELNVFSSEHFLHMHPSMKVTLLTGMILEYAKRYSIEDVLNFDAIELKFLIIRAKPRYRRTTNTYGIVVGKFINRQDEFIFYLPHDMNDGVEESIFYIGEFDYVTKKILNICLFFHKDKTAVPGIFAGIPMN